MQDLECDVTSETAPCAPAHPVRLGAREGVEVDRPRDALHHAGSGVLPEAPVLTGIGLARMAGHGAEPEFLSPEATEVVVGEEVDGRVDDRALAHRVADDALEGRDLGADRGRIGPGAAGARGMV